jgi:hypothetical protein
MQMRWLWCVVVAGSALITGCGPATGTVSGSVTIDGQPLDKGVISYVPADNQGVPVTANVVGGQYELTALAGKKFVQISAPIVVGQRKEYEGEGAPLVEITDERLPSKYNSQTELTFEIQSGRNAKDWAVESQKRKP